MSYPTYREPIDDAPDFYDIAERHAEITDKDILLMTVPEIAEYMHISPQYANTIKKECHERNKVKRQNPTIVKNAGLKRKVA